MLVGWRADAGAPMASAEAQVAIAASTAMSEREVRERGMESPDTGVT